MTKKKERKLNKKKTMKTMMIKREGTIVFVKHQIIKKMEIYSIFYVKRILYRGFFDFCFVAL